jgi:Xaa-Pro aminopeptidase
MPIIEKIDSEIYKQRREKLISFIKEQYPKEKNGVIVLFADFEKECSSFRQESSFFYVTGIEEPACALVIDLAEDKTILFVPNFGKERQKWMADSISADQNLEQKFGVDAITYLGNPCTGYQCHPFFTHDEYAHLLQFLETCVVTKRTIFTLNPENKHAYIEQRFILQRIAQVIPVFQTLLKDISPLIENMRRIKDGREIELLYKAVDLTIDAQYVLAPEIRPDIIEYELQGLIEYMFIGKGGTTAFPSIVASGKNSTVLHYHHNNKKLKEGELLVIDIGAEYNHYCADLTRTYPVSGNFTKRQREVYMAVLDTQDYIAEMAKPGMWLSNREKPEQSLHHLAIKYLASKGYDKYFIHGIGHFLGLEVHDVGNYQKPLEPGDVITIEPGIYIPQEEIGIRIEDDYWIVEDGAICLSEQLPKYPEDIEQMMKDKKE